MRQARDLAVRIVAMDDVVLRRLHQLRLGALHCGSRRVAIAALDRFLDGAHRAAQLGPARLVDDGAAGNLAGRLLGGSGIGHIFKYPYEVPTAAGRAWLPRRCKLAIDADLCSGVLRRKSGRSQLARRSRGVAQRTAAAGLRPPPLAGLIEGVLASVNAFGRRKWPCDTSW